ncbi:MAG: aspartate 1-decarboxylase [Acidobacteriota bacterium]|nr:aspartate 1-decarboxylase [Acidobacteriota bacterium]
MRRPFLLSKIHRAVVTAADLEYVGSLTLDQDLMDAAGMLPHQQIEIYNVTRGTRLSTYLIPGAHGEGDCCINGAAAHLCEAGDRIIICAYADLDDDEVSRHEPRVVLVRRDNKSFETAGRERPHTRFADEHA